MRCGRRWEAVSSWARRFILEDIDRLSLARDSLSKGFLLLYEALIHCLCPIASCKDE